MTELSQAERTAREKAWKDASMLPPSPRRIRELGDLMWLAARDYGRERERKLLKDLQDTQVRATTARQDHLEAEGRERSLREALSRLLNASRDIMPYEKKGPVNELIEAETHADEVLAASQPEVLSERSDTEPGEPGGQPACKTCEDSGRVLVSDGPATTPCPHCRDMRGRPLQPDHGPGESGSQKAIHRREGTVPCEKCGVSLSPSEYAFSHKCSEPFPMAHGPGEPEITQEMIERGVAEADRLHAEDELGRCSYCGETFPVPVEFHHAEADCPGLKRRLQEGESNG